MEKTIDVHDLPDEDVMVIQQMVDLLRKRIDKPKTETTEEKIEFGAWPLGVKGNLSRSEIYEDR